MNEKTDAIIGAAGVVLVLFAAIAFAVLFR